MSFVTIESADVPAHLLDRVCRCGSRPDGFTVANDLGFSWALCPSCRKPAPLNAQNARLFRECEFCEDYYFVTHWPDKNDVCPQCQ